MSNHYKEYNLYGRAIADVGKYSALLSGIYCVAQDEVNLSGAVIAGCGYAIAATLKETLRERADSQRTTSIEDKLGE